MMNMPDNENVVRIMDCFEDSQYFYTLLEACDGGDLFDFFRMLMSDDMETEALEKEVRTVMGELLLSLDHLHKQGLVHKDVKLENAVFKKKRYPPTRKPNWSKHRLPRELKLIDFDYVTEW